MFNKLKERIINKLLLSITKDDKYLDGTIALIEFDNPDMNLAIIVNHTKTKNILVYYLDTNKKLYINILTNYEADNNSILSIIDKAIINHNNNLSNAFIKRVYYQQKTITY